MKILKVKTYLLLALILQGFLISIDQLFKHCVLLHRHDTYLCKFLKIELFKNYNFYFGLFRLENQVIYLAIDFIIILCLMALMVSIINRGKKTGIIISVISVFSGIVSNLIDKYSNGYTIDYLSLIIFELPINQFNLADVYIITGLIGIIIVNYRKKKLR